MSLNRLLGLIALIRAKGRDFYPAEWQIRGDAPPRRACAARPPSRRAVALNELAFRGEC